MKKQLFIALLTLTPFFTSAKPTNAELLAHLKHQLKFTKDRIEFRHDIAKTLDKTENKNEYNFLINLCKEVFSHPAIQKIINREIQDITESLNQLCQMNTIEENSFRRALDPYIFETYDTIRETFKTVALPIFTKHHAIYRQKFSKKTLGNLSFKNLDSNEIVDILIYIKSLSVSHQTIETKIKELQQA